MNAHEKTRLDRIEEKIDKMADASRRFTLARIQHLVMHVACLRGELDRTGIARLTAALGVKQGLVKFHPGTIDCRHLGIQGLQIGV